MKISPYLAILALIAVSESGYAETVYPCDTSCTGLFSKAMQLARTLPDRTVFSVIDVKTWEAGTYRVEHYYRFGEYLERARKLTTTTRALSAASQLQAAQAAVQSLKIDIPANIAPDVHAVIVSSQTEGDVASYLVSNATVLDKLGNYTHFLLEAFGILVDTPGHVQVEFSDGSTARFELTGLGEDDDGNVVYELQLQEGSAEDSDGNTIPTSPDDDVIGERTFSSESNLDRFIHVVDFYGATTEYGGCGSATAAVCVLNSGGGYSCTTFTYCR